MKDVGRVGKKPAENDRTIAIYQSVLNQNSLYFIGRRHQDVIVLNRKVSRFFPNLFRLIQPQFFYLSPKVIFSKTTWLLTS